MDYNKYSNDGWGLSKLQLTQLYSIIQNHSNNKIRVVEFGSGKSTHFLVDLKLELEGVKDIEIVSFDDNPEYAYKNADNHTFLDLKIRPLMECTDEVYSKMFETKVIDVNSIHLKKTPLTSRQKNNFYTINDGDLVGIYDLMILDGPNGNGRNISYLHMKNHLTEGSIVLIDDCTHYDFVEKFNLFFNYEIIYENKTGSNNQWVLGGDYVILKIISSK